MMEKIPKSISYISQDGWLQVTRRAYRYQSQPRIYCEWELEVNQGTFRARHEFLVQTSKSAHIGMGRKLSKLNREGAHETLRRWGREDLLDQFDELVERIELEQVFRMRDLSDGSGDREPRKPQDPLDPAGVSRSLPGRLKTTSHVGAEPPPGHKDPLRQETSYKPTKVGKKNTR